MLGIDLVEQFAIPVYVSFNDGSEAVGIHYQISREQFAVWDNEKRSMKFYKYADICYAEEIENV